LREREYLTPKEVDCLQDAARKHSRYGHRDATAILIAYRHGLRVSELCELTWNMIELDGGRIHVRRAKNGVDSTHPLTGKEIRALRQLRRENLQSRYVFNTERGGSGDQGLVPQNGPPDWGIGQTALPNPSAHAAARLRVLARQRRRPHPSAAALPGPPQHHAHGAIYRVALRPLRWVLEGQTHSALIAAQISEHKHIAEDGVVEVTRCNGREHR